MKLCEKTGRRLRRAKFQAKGVYVATVFTDGSWWHKGRKFEVPVSTTQEIFVKGATASQRLRLSEGRSKPRCLRLRPGAGE
jgi:impB/mucB/samB family protein